MHFEYNRCLCPTGPNGIYPSSSGLKMVYLSGKEAASHAKSASTFTFDDISSLETQATAKPAIDILLTSQWPNAVCNYAKKPVSVVMQVQRYFMQVNSFL